MGEVICKDEDGFEYRRQPDGSWEWRENEQDRWWPEEGMKDMLEAAYQAGLRASEAQAERLREALRWTLIYVRMPEIRNDILAPEQWARHYNEAQAALAAKD